MSWDARTAQSGYGKVGTGLCCTTRVTQRGEGRALDFLYSIQPRVSTVRAEGGGGGLARAGPGTNNPTLLGPRDKS
jgi:hypothetical protein